MLKASKMLWHPKIEDFEDKMTLPGVKWKGHTRDHGKG